MADSNFPQLFHNSNSFSFTNSSYSGGGMELEQNQGDIVVEGGVGTNFSHHEPPQTSYRIDFYRKSTLEIFFATFSGIANILIFFLIVSNKTFRRRTNFLIANLCLASVAYIVAIMFRALGSKWQLDLDYGPHLCGIMAVGHRFAIPVMSLTTMAISLERSRSAVATTPRQLIPSKAFTGLKILVIWSLSIFVTLPTAFIHVYNEDYPKIYNGSSNAKCPKVLLCGSIWVHGAYVVFNATIVYVVPAAVLIGELLRMQKKMSFLVCRQKPGITCKNNERLRLVRNSSIFTAIFISCWLPIGTWLIIYDLPREIFPQEWRSSYASVFNYCHLGTNYFIWSIPIILFIISQNLRESLCNCKLFTKFSKNVKGCALIQYFCCCLVCTTPVNSVSGNLELENGVI